MTLPTVAQVMTDTSAPVDRMIPVAAASIEVGLRRLTQSRMKSGQYYYFGWDEVYQPSRGCKYGCKVYARKQGAVIRYAVMHSSSYGHPRAKS